ncbi:hypothetical protein HHS_06190 [Candidatus Pantoea carbekii]|uniref:Tryptophan synthase alpha chain n=1 Tax=Candidatus Pantoea carbekii TaxID=1235990 RepID=U3U8B6_9GAMM|nr:hypothetical protein HHS_06190 [Candidatus Pantoea carbekii]
MTQEGAFVPFVILGDPSLTLSLDIVDALIHGGADALELGIPFSDPIAEGVTIQAANLRALSANTTVEQCFKVIQFIRRKYSDIPIGLMLYANLVFNRGINNFYADCKIVGVDSVLIVDLPIEESELFYNSAIYYKINPVFICPPNADDALLHKIALYSRGYTYLLSRSGVTGVEKPTILLSHYLINKLCEYNAAPLLYGFGISDPIQIKKAIALGVAGVISGSAIIKIIECYQNDINLMLINLKKFVTILKNATQSKCIK